MTEVGEGERRPKRQLLGLLDRKNSGSYRPDQAVPELVIERPSWTGAAVRVSIRHPAYPLSNERHSASLCEDAEDGIVLAMHVSRSDLADFAYFLALARHRSFRRAGLELGVSASALSHSLKGLETRIGVRLFNRTSRSVTLTAAGEELHAALVAPFDAIDEAAERLNRYRNDPVGRIRLNVMDQASALLLAPVLPVFVQRHPQIAIDVATSNHLVDVVAHGADAGIRWGGTVPEDMVAQRLSADVRWVVVGTPAYLDRHGTPSHPRDLADHHCLRLRLGDDSIYQWEFEKDGEEIAIDVPGAITLNETQFAITLAAVGTGLAYLPEPSVTPLVENGALRLILADWASLGPGFHIYYPGRRQLLTGLRLLIDLIRELRPLGL